MASALRKAAAFLRNNLTKMASGSPTGSLVWIDCEVRSRLPALRIAAELLTELQMTGLNRETDQIMSLCCLITDANLNILDPKGYEATIHHDQATLDRMDDWCTKTHGNSGLTKACLASNTSHASAAMGLLGYIKEHIPYSRTGLLAGNSVHVDKEFLSKSPYDAVLKHLHYRILDVSSIKEAAQRWAPGKMQEAPLKRGLHQARDDILESIQEARFYRDTFFRER